MKWTDVLRETVVKDFSDSILEDLSNATYLIDKIMREHSETYLYAMCHIEQEIAACSQAIKPANIESWEKCLSEIRGAYEHPECLYLVAGSCLADAEEMGIKTGIQKLQKLSNQLRETCISLPEMSDELLPNRQLAKDMLNPVLQVRFDDACQKQDELFRARYGMFVCVGYLFKRCRIQSLHDRFGNDATYDNIVQVFIDEEWYSKG